MASIVREGGAEGIVKAASALARVNPTIAAAVLVSVATSDASLILLAMDHDSRTRVLTSMSLEEQATIIAAIPAQTFISMVRVWFDSSLASLL